ncbi:MAG: PspC domain-containing protein [Bacteroidales bacterium]|nr:PspC domain-containing protein [Bacteroidales bacterium]
MKKVINVGIGGRTFIIDEDAYQRLDAYIERFKEKVKMGLQTNEVIEEVEIRIAELFIEFLGTRQEVVNIAIVNKVISQLGMPDGTDADKDFMSNENMNTMKTTKKFFRDPDSKIIGGVCSGLAAYLDIDVTLIRIIFLVALICGSLGFWIYVIFWIVAPVAKSASDKCEMRGLPITAENLKRFSGSGK